MDKHNEERLKEFGLLIAKLRKERGLSLRELSARTGIEHKIINNIELNKRGLKLETLFRLADGLEVDPKDLLDFDLLKKK